MKSAFMLSVAFLLLSSVAVAQPGGFGGGFSTGGPGVPKYVTSVVSGPQGPIMAWPSPGYLVLALCSLCFCNEPVIVHFHCLPSRSICPGPTDTPLLAGFDETGKLQKSLERAVPMRRLADPADFPALVQYFLSAEAGYVTGQTISVSGGLSMHG